MTTTYEMIRAIPATGLDWTGFCLALRAKVVAAGAAQAFTIEGWDAARGMREIRTAAMEMANFYVDKVSKRVNVIAPSAESRAGDSFEGGHHDVWNDADATEAATQEIAELIECYRLGRNLELEPQAANWTP